MLSNTWSFVRTFEERKINNKQLFCATHSVIMFFFFFIRKRKPSVDFHPTVPSGSTSSRCLASPLCMPVRT